MMRGMRKSDLSRQSQTPTSVDDFLHPARPAATMLAMTLTPEELTAFHTAASAALGTNEVLEHAAQRHAQGIGIRQDTIDRVISTLKSTAIVMWEIYKRTNWLPRIRFRGYLFALSISPPDVIDVQIIPEDGIVNA
jgi:hypothetical protein